MSYSPTLAVQRAKMDVGFVEGPNNRNPYSFWQYGNSYNPYCDSAVCMWSWEAGFRFPSYSAYGEKGDANVGAHHYHAVRQGIWRSAWTRSRPGWLVDLTFGIADQHIEMVLSDQGGDRIATIGGNTGDRVAYRIRYRSNIVGFIALDEAGQTDPHAPPPTSKPKPVPRRSLVTTVAFPHQGKGRRPTARAIPELNTVLLENGARVRQDKASGKNRVWMHPNVTPGGKLIDIAAVDIDEKKPLSGQVIFTALVDLGHHDIATYDALIP